MTSFDVSRKFEYQPIRVKDIPTLRAQFPDRNLLLKIDGRISKIFAKIFWEDRFGLVHDEEGRVFEVSDLASDLVIKCAVERNRLLRLGMETYNGIDIAVVKSWRYDPEDI